MIDIDHLLCNMNSSLMIEHKVIFDWSILANHYVGFTHSSITITTARKRSIDEGIVIHHLNLTGFGPQVNFNILVDSICAKIIIHDIQ